MRPKHILTPNEPQMKFTHEPGLSPEYETLPMPPEPEVPYSYVRPRDAATLIILDQSSGVPRVLMGKRHPGHRFMPDKFVFPGGRVDPADSRLRTGNDLDDLTKKRLLIGMKGKATENRARALALAAIRETFEETGILIGEPMVSPVKTKSVVWNGYCEQGLVPALGGLSFIARAITPPKRRRRYDTRFFCASADDIVKHTGIQDGELLDLHWLSIEDAMEIDVPHITKIILQDLQKRLDPDGILDRYAPVPIYYTAPDGFRRHLITLNTTS